MQRLVVSLLAVCLGGLLAPTASAGPLSPITDELPLGEDPTGDKMLDLEAILAELEEGIEEAMGEGNEVAMETLGAVHTALKEVQEDAEDLAETADPLTELVGAIAHRVRNSDECIEHKSSPSYGAEPHVDIDEDEDVYTLMIVTPGSTAQVMIDSNCLSEMEASEEGG